MHLIAGMACQTRASSAGVPCGHEIRRRFVQTRCSRPDHTAYLVIVISRLRPLFVGQLIADGVNAVSAFGSDRRMAAIGFSSI